MIFKNKILESIIIPLDETKQNYAYSLSKTTTSSKDNSIKKEKTIEEVFKPQPKFKLDNIFNLEPKNFFIQNLNKIKFNDNFKFNNDKINFIEKKTFNNLNDNFKLIEKKENVNILNSSAFKTIENKNEEEKNERSAFKKYISIIRGKKIINKNKKRKRIKEIIINEINNNNNKDRNKEKRKERIFKSIRYMKVERKKDEENNEEKMELIIIKKKRGRKPKNEIKIKRIHNAYDYDNILRKIQVHFLTFIINFANDLIDGFIPNNKILKFKNLDYKFKKIVKHSYVEKLKKMKISEILQFDASSKNRKYESSINKQIYDDVCKLSPYLFHFFEKTYLDLFNSYYNTNSRTFNIEGININISQKTKLLIDLINKNNIVEDKIKQIASNIFSLKQNTNIPIFVINKNK